MRRKAASCLLIAIIFSLSTGCTSGSPSDEEAVRLVKDYYLFFYSGRVVEVKLVKRGEYIKENKCYPIDFIIIPPGKESFRKTFYFFKNEEGTIEVREYQFG